MGATEKLLRFGVFELNLDAEELRKDGTPIKLPPQPVKILALLASRAGQVVTRDEIQTEIWGEETYVDFEHGLNQCIKQIRTALNDNADKPLYVETLPRRGYRFLAPVVSKTVATPPPRVTESGSGIQSRVSLPAAPGAVEPAANHTSDTVMGAPAGTLPSPGTDATATAAVVAPENTKTIDSKAVRRKAHWLIAWAALGLVAVVAIAFYWRTRRVSALTEKDTIVLADFDNSTGEAVFDTALKAALAVGLEQSPFLNVLSEQRVREQLRFMGQATSTHLTEDQARQVCQRSGSKAVLSGSVASLGSHYVIGLRAENCNSGDLLAAVQGEAENREQALKVLNKAASTMRGKLGESVTSIQKYGTPIEQASTPSLEALQAYSLGLKSQETEGEAAAVPFYKRAVDLDPNFAMAFVRLGVAYSNLNEQRLSAENMTRAYALRDRTSEKERLYITAHYYAEVEGNLPKAIEAYTVFKQTYPREDAPYDNLCVIYSYIGKYEQALVEAKEALRLNPSDAPMYANYVLFYLSLERFDKAKSMLKEAQAHKVEHEYLAYYFYILAFLTGDHGEMNHQLVAAAGKPYWEDQLLAAQSETEAFEGRLAKSREYTDRSMKAAALDGGKDRAKTWQLYGALHDAEVGESRRALVEAAAALSGTSGKDAQILGALALARGGNVERSRVLVQQLAKQYPADTMMQWYWLPTIRAAIEMNLENPGEAKKQLEVTTDYELGAPVPGNALMYPVYLRGLACLKTGQANEAETEFKKILSHKGIVQNFVIGSLAELQLARAQAMSLKNDAARKSYQSFFESWKEADPDVPILAEAKREYAQLD